MKHLTKEIISIILALSIFFIPVFLLKADPNTGTNKPKTDLEIRCIFSQVIIIHKRSGHMIQLSNKNVFMRCTPKIAKKIESGE